MKSAKKILVAVLVLVLLTSAFSVNPVIAAGDDYPYRNGAIDVPDQWNFLTRECTSFVAWCLNSRNGVNFTNYYLGYRWGNASNWGYAASQAGIAVDNNPVVGAVAWASSGHVAWVSAVVGNTVYVEEYNYWINGALDYSYHTSSHDKSYYSGYIHIKDTGSSSGPISVYNTEVKNVTDTNAWVYGRLDKPSASTVTQVGVAIYASDGVTLLQEYYETPGSCVGMSYVIIYYNINGELGRTLTPGTTYYYKIEANVDGVVYWSTLTSFKTTGTQPVTNAAAPSITAQPTAVSVVKNGTASLTTAATVAKGVLSYQWYTNSGTLLNGATSQTFSAPTGTIGYQEYYCLVTNTDNTATGVKTATTKSNTVRVTVTSPPAAPSISSLTPNKASPQAAGTSITWTCAASGGTSLQYQFYMYTSATGWQLARAYSSSNTFNWTPTTAGDYGICVWVKDVASSNAYDATLSNGYRAYTPVKISSISPNKASPQPTGTSVTWSCSASGGTSLQYQFYVHTNSEGWVLVQPYSSKNTITLTSSTAGDYGVCVWVKDANSTNSYDAASSSGYRTYIPVAVSSITPNKASPQPAGTSIMWTCAASGGTSLQYQFYIYTSAAGWQLARAYSSSNTFNWTPTTAGDYGICVWVKDAASSNAYDATLSNGFRTITPVTIGSISPNKTSPQPTGTSVTWTCAASGGTSLQYQFYVHTNSDGWVLAQPYSSNNKITLTSSTAGDYGVCVWVKDAASTNSYDATLSSGYRTYFPVAINSISPNKASPQPAGTSVTWSCNASGGTSLQYQFYVYTSSSGWVLAQAYSSSNTITLTSSTAGDYGVCVWVKDAASTNSYDATLSSGYRTYTPVLISVLTPNITSPQSTGTPVTWSCNASGGTSLQYQFYVYTSSSGWVLAQAYSSSNTITLTSSTAGDYGVCVWVKDAASSNSYDAYLSSGYQITS